MSSPKRKNLPSSKLYAEKSAYCREKDLSRLAGLWPGEINTSDIEVRERIVSILRNALRIERQRGKSGHWCYDLNRHLALKYALAQEIAALKLLTRDAHRCVSPKAPSLREHHVFSQASSCG
ncbi:MAG: hypothetical protein KTR19_01150 [Hyphomicrobiales bacterium]|nr:hypothetical protein [Hyphomicrobiales bacterium]